MTVAATVALGVASTLFLLLSGSQLAVLCACITYVALPRACYGAVEVVRVLEICRLFEEFVDEAETGCRRRSSGDQVSLCLRN